MFFIWIHSCNKVIPFMVGVFQSFGGAEKFIKDNIDNNAKIRGYATYPFAFDDGHVYEELEYVESMCDYDDNDVVTFNPNKLVVENPFDCKYFPLDEWSVHYNLKELPKIYKNMAIFNHCDYYAAVITCGGPCDISRHMKEIRDSIA